MPSATKGVEPGAAPPESHALGTLRELFASGRPLLYLRSSEEQRIALLLRDAARTFFPSPVPIWTWSLTEGMRRDDGSVADTQPLTPRAALDYIADYDGPAIFHLKDFHEPLRETPETRRRLRDLSERCLDAGKFVVISSPVKFVPEELERSIVYVELNVPDLSELVAFLRSEASVITGAGGTGGTSDATLYQLGRALQGLTLDEARHAVRRALSAHQTLNQASLPTPLE